MSLYLYEGTFNFAVFRYLEEAVNIPENKLVKVFTFKPVLLQAGDIGKKTRNLHTT